MPSVGFDLNQHLRYQRYLETYAEVDLQKYCYFLEHGIYPHDTKIILPSL